MDCTIPSSRSGSDHHPGQRGHGLVVGGEPRGTEVDRGGRAEHRADLAEQPDGPARRPSSPSASSTLSTPNPATWEAAEPASAGRRPRPAWQTGPSPAPPSAPAADGHDAAGTSGRPAATATSVHALAGVEEEVDDRRSGADQQRGQPRDEHGPPADEGLLVVLAVGAERPRRRADHQSDQRQGQGPARRARS